jgi:acetylornithine deacetylase/succinyl-diaminopimelate desuccinylase-like protein
VNEAVLSYVRTEHPRYLSELFSFLQFASVSADSAFKKDVDACAEFVCDALTQAGLDQVQLFPTKGHPIVYAEKIVDDGLPTVLIYGHYDVQPPDPLNLWETPPFSPEIRDGRIYARGVSDDKGQIYCHIKAIEAWIKTAQLPVNVKVLIEGEEEIGSPNLLPFILAHKDLLKADVALVSDTPMMGPGCPSICYSLRGLLYTEISVFGTASDLHSGQNGGAVPNAIEGLHRILNQLKNQEGQVMIPEFYEGVPELTPEERSQIQALPFSDSEYQQSLGASALVGEIGYSTLERRWFRPTLDVNGIWGGYIGEGSKTVIPCEAHAKLSMRLVGAQNPQRIAEHLEAYLQEVCPQGYRVSMRVHSMAVPAYTNPQHPAVLAGLRAVESAFVAKAVLQGEGGTIPVVSDFATELGIPTVLMGFNLPDDCIHAPNERFTEAHFYKGIEASARFLNEILSLKK